jgi:hypothetical protein
MNSKVISFSGIVFAVVLSFASGHTIGNQEVLALGGYGGHGFSHGYGPGYPIFPCGSGPYSIINGQIVCTPA